MRGVIIDNFALPFAVAVITYWLIKKHDERINRKNYSTLGVAIMESLLEEVNNGIKIMKNQQLIPLPVKSWNGIMTVSDDVLLRIIGVARNKKSIGFAPKEIRIHCKNYFEFMATNWETAIKSNSPQNIQSLINQGKYVQAAEGVRDMLVQCRDLLEENAKKMFPQ